MDLSISHQIAVDFSDFQSINNSIDPHDQNSIDTCYSWRLLPFNLPPQRRILASTIERVVFTSNQYGIVCLRSTWARLGLLAPPTIVDPGFRGFLTMELFNANLSPIIIRPGDYVWNLLVVETPHPILEMYKGRYQDQKDGVKLPIPLTNLNPKAPSQA